ncbi:glycerophosphodiester phosphodiesterase [Micromonospora sp. URMC 103]|uniref:glycerophosphodiester phosphodiesterase n=1 Tax=Micromonospora sp. URMC 103 TaxID=3423406 RepID=UPI003F198CC9
MTWRVFNDQPALIGHRGMGQGLVAGYRENSVESFRAAAEAGLDWVELDVQRTTDDDLMVTHDPVLPDGRYIAEMTSGQAARRGLVRLDDLLEELPLTLGVVFDVKSGLHDAARSADSTTATLLARSCERTLGDRPALALSFDPGALRHMREAVPDMALGLLTWKQFPIGHAVAAAAHLDVQVLAVHTSSLWRDPSASATAPSIESVVERVHSSQRQVLVWCPDTREALDFAAAHVDALVVDDVPRHVQALSESRSAGDSCAR